MKRLFTFLILALTLISLQAQFVDFQTEIWKGVFAADKYPALDAVKIASRGFVDFDLNGLIDYCFFGNGAGNCVIYFQ